MHQRVSGHTARLIVRALAVRTELEVPEILEKLEISGEELASRETTFAKSTMDALWDRALELSGDEGFGMSLSGLLAPGMLGAVEYLFKNSSTLGEAYLQLVRFQNLLQQNTSRWSVDTGADAWVVGYELVPPVAPAYRHIVEFAVSSFVALGRQVASEPWAPEAIAFGHARGAPIERYRDTLGVVPTFEAPATRIRLSSETCALAVEGADAHLAAIVREHADRLRGQLSSTSTADAVRRTVVETMDRGEVTLKTVASALTTSERTLRRKLSDEGESFQDLVDQVRFDVAKSYLAQDRLTTDEIALLLGFSEVSAFYRAFRRWHGASLSDYRAGQSSR